MEMTRGYVGAEARSGNDLTKQGGGCQVQLNARAGVSIASSIGGKVYIPRTLGRAKWNGPAGMRSSGENARAGKARPLLQYPMTAQ